MSNFRRIQISCDWHLLAEPIQGPKETVTISLCDPFASAGSPEKTQVEVGV
jgi:hypothetical protein